jgi:hypothetical protein
MVPGDQPASAGRGPGSCDSGNALAVAAITETRDAEADELLETTSDIGQCVLLNLDCPPAATPAAHR